MTDSPDTARRRTTQNRRIVVEILGEGDNFRSARQLHLDIQTRRHVPVSLTSVYRILHALADDGIAETQPSEDGELLYRVRSNPDHCHYLLCRNCGRAVPFIPTTFEEHTAMLSREHDYADVTHRIDLYGTCPRCHAESV